MQVTEWLDYSTVALKDIPKKQRKYGVCCWYVGRNGRDLRHVPVHHRTLHMVTLAVGSYAKAYLLASFEIRCDRALTMLAVRRGGIQVWRSVPLRVVDEELCMAAVKGCGGVLQYVPSPFRSYAVCRAACVAGGARLQDIPGEYLSEAFFEGVALPNVPECFRSRRYCVKWVGIKGNYLRYVPLQLIDFRMLRVALRNDPWAHRFVPQMFHDNKYYKAARKKLIGMTYEEDEDEQDCEDDGPESDWPGAGSSC